MVICLSVPGTELLVVRPKSPGPSLVLEPLGQALWVKMSAAWSVHIRVCSGSPRKVMVSLWSGLFVLVTLADTSLVTVPLHCGCHYASSSCPALTCSSEALPRDPGLWAAVITLVGLWVGPTRVTCVNEACSLEGQMNEMLTPMAVGKPSEAPSPTLLFRSLMNAFS